MSHMGNEHIRQLNSRSNQLNFLEESSCTQLREGRATGERLHREEMGAGRQGVGGGVGQEAARHSY